MTVNSMCMHVLYTLKLSLWCLFKNIPLSPHGTEMTKLVVLSEVALSVVDLRSHYKT